MKVHVVDPAAAVVVPVPSPLPVIPPATLRPRSQRRVQDAVESILFYGLLAVGVLFPVFGALYAYVFK